MFSLLDGRGKLYQWDLDRKLTINDNTIIEVHFANCLCPVATVCRSYEEDGATVVDIPNELLTEYMDIRVWGFDGKATKHEQVFEVEKKTKPAEYIYTPTEVWTVEKAVEEALEEAKASGDFKGDKGDKGDAGAIEFVVVTELPAIGDGSKIYLLPETDGEEPNRFGEYVFIEGAWERIGSAGVEVNLDEYVKNTDYADKDRAGIVRLNSFYGMYAKADGTLYTVPASQDDINKKISSYNPIVPKTLDYAVKKALADCKLADTDYAWTEEEKTAARELLGAVGATDYATSNKAGLIKANSIHGFFIDAATGDLSIVQAQDSDFTTKTNKFRPVTVNNLDLAVKTGITTNTIELTDGEKAAACAWLGVSDLIAELTARIEALEGVSE